MHAGDAETFLNQNTITGSKRERRVAKLKKRERKPIDMKHNGELIESIRLDKIIAGEKDQSQITEMKKLFTLAGLSKRQSKKILNNENALMDVICGIISDFDPNQQREQADSVFEAQSNLFRKQGTMRREATTVEKPDARKTEVTAMVAMVKVTEPSVAASQVHTSMPKA